MTTQTWMLAISIGPVGEFIAAGRRSRDLWWGSTWLSRLVLELSATPFLPTEATLLLPRLKRPRSSVDPARYGGRVANKLLIRVTGDQDDVRRLAERLRTAANAWLAGELTKSRDFANRQAPGLIHEDDFEEQRQAIAQGDFVEFRAGWTQCTKAFSDDVKRARQLCDASPRLFRRPTTRPGLPKSHLDPGRDNALRALPNPTHDRDAYKQALSQRARLGLLDGEALDALYLARRLACFDGSTEQLGKLPFPSVVRIAMEPWLVGVQGTMVTELDWLRAHVQRASKSEDFFAWCSPADNPGEASGANFAYDTSFMLDGELDARLKDAARRYWDPTPLVELRPTVEHLHKQRGAPIPYYALLELDGDGVGDALSQMDEKSWGDAVDTLTGLSDQIPSLVKQHGGIAFYAAADEMLIYAPVDTALDLVIKLQALWKKETAQTLSKTSLSAGVVIVHVKDDLTAARHAVHAALTTAKQTRRRLNATHSAFLCVEERPRGGAPRAVTGPLAELAPRLHDWATALDASDMNQVEAPEDGEPSSATEPLSLRSAHILDEHIRRLAGVDAAVPLARGALIRQVGKEKPADPAGRKLLRERVVALTIQTDLEALRDELLIAARIGRVANQRKVKA